MLWLLILLGCTGKTLQAAGPLSWWVYVDDTDVSLIVDTVEPDQCWTIGSSITAEADGQPMTVASKGGARWDSPKGIPRRTCDSPTFTIPRRRLAKSPTFALSDGTTRYEARWTDPLAPRTLSATPATVHPGDTVTLVRTPTTDTWAADTMVTVYAGDGHPDETCAFDLGEAMRFVPSGAQLVATVPSVSCPGPYSLAVEGQSMFPVETCPAGHTCEASVAIPGWVPLTVDPPR